MTTHDVRRKGKRHLSYVESESEADHEYEIAQLPDKTLACACMAFVFSKASPKACKHLTAYLAGELMDTRRAVKAVTRQETVTIAAAGERFKVRRAITFGDVPIN